MTCHWCCKAAICRNNNSHSLQLLLSSCFSCPVLLPWTAIWLYKTIEVQLPMMPPHCLTYKKPHRFFHKPALDYYGLLQDKTSLSYSVPHSVPHTLICQFILYQYTMNNMLQCQANIMCVHFLFTSSCVYIFFCSAPIQMGMHCELIPASATNQWIVVATLLYGIVWYPYHHGINNIPSVCSVYSDFRGLD